jgi:hypothetical protein
MIKKLITKLITLWRAETPLIARALQALCGAVLLLPMYYGQLPADFQILAPGELKYITIAALVAGAGLNLLQKKDK